LRFSCCVSIPALAADVNGKWKASFQDPNGQNMEIIFDLKVDGEKLTGTADSPMGNNTITEGKLVGDAISFTVDAPAAFIGVRCKCCRPICRCPLPYGKRHKTIIR
jgi:hypothetical protein